MIFFFFPDKLQEKVSAQNSYGLSHDITPDSDRLDGFLPFRTGSFSIVIFNSWKKW